MKPFASDFNKVTGIFLCARQKEPPTPFTEWRFFFTKGMGEMFTFKQRGVSLYVIYFTFKRYHAIINKSIFHNLFHIIVI